MICKTIETSQKQKILQPRNDIQQEELTDRDGLDMAYKSSNDIAIIGNTLYIAGTKKDRLGDWYDNIKY